jgi:hypothetical protein
VQRNKDLSGSEVKQYTAKHDLKGDTITAPRFLGDYVDEVVV